MQLALIPPYELADDMWQCSDISLGLAHLLHGCDRTHIYRQAWNLSGYKILDNGAAEHATISDEAFVYAAMLYGANELVIPDVLARPEQTLQKGEQFMQKYGDQDYKFMYVLQGNDMKEAAAHLRVVLDKPWWPKITCLGLPRLLVTQHHRDVRIDLAKWIHLDLALKDRAIHFLGASSKWPTELREAVREVPFVRSMDTSMPYVYGLDGRSVEGGDIVNRPPNYFNYRLMEEQREYVFKNVETMLRWAKGEE
jgi:hypothetical protein